MNLKSMVDTWCPSFLRPLLVRLEHSPIGLRLARGVFWSIAGAVISRGLMLAATILVARMLGKAVYGELGMLRSTVGMLGIFAGFGLGLTATKHVAEFRRRDPARAGRILGIAGMFATITGGLMALGLYVFAPWLAEHTLNAPHLAGTLRIGTLILFINTLNGAQTGALSGFEAFKTIARVNLFVGLMSFPILVAGAYLGGLNGTVWALAINLGLNWVLNHMALRTEARRCNVHVTMKNCRRELPVLWKFSLPAFISGTLVSPVFWICKSMLANQPGGYAGLGAYTVAESWRALVFFVCQRNSQVSFPILSQCYGEGDRRLFRKVLLTQFTINGVIVIGGALVVIALSGVIMDAYGPEFSNSRMVLVVVMIGAIPQQLAGVAGQVNKCVGTIWWGVLLNGLWAMVCLVATFALIGYGVLGLAWAMLIAYGFHLISTTVYVVLVFRTSSKLSLDTSS